MKRILLAFLLIVAEINTYALDFSAVCSTGQTLYYNITSDSTAEVTYPSRCNGGYGDPYYAYYFWSVYHSGYEKPSGYLVIPDTVTYNGIVYRVTAIGTSAFQQCYNLDTVIVGNNIVSIGDYAFNACGLHYLVLKHSIAHIGNCAFNGTALEYLYYDCPNVINPELSPCLIDSHEPIAGTVPWNSSFRLVLADPFYSIRTQTKVHLQPPVFTN